MLLKHIAVALLVVLWSVSIVFGAETKTTQPSDAKDAVAIQGTWLPSAAELAGKKYPDEVRKSIKLVIKDDTYAVTVGQAPPDRGTVKLDPSASPKAIDIAGTEGPNKGKTFLAIYELSGDTLRICYDLSGQSRPGEFRTEPNTALFLVTYQRAKD